MLLTIAQPFAHHNGGALRFGPDGYLYIGMGDGGSGNDPGGLAQDRRELLGKILRIDVDRGSPYAIPAGNPYADGVAGRAEIWAIGLRNPWRFAFDRATGDFYIGDVGQDSFEEVDRLPAGTGAGANLGWRVAEGFHCTGLSGPIACTDAGLTPPILEYTHAMGCSITGGTVYRGSGVPALADRYVYADFCNGRIWSASPGAGGAWHERDVLANGSSIAAFGYRIWNARADSNHRYTISAGIRDQMVADGGIAEGYGPKAVAMCSAVWGARRARKLTRHMRLVIIGHLRARAAHSKSPVARIPSSKRWRTIDVACTHADGARRRAVVRCHGRGPDQHRSHTVSHRPGGLARHSREEHRRDAADDDRRPEDQLDRARRRV